MRGNISHVLTARPSKSCSLKGSSYTKHPHCNRAKIWHPSLAVGKPSKQPSSQSQQKLQELAFKGWGNRSAKLKGIGENVRYMGHYVKAGQSVWRLVTVNDGAAPMGCWWASACAPKKTALPLSKLSVPPWIKITTRPHGMGLECIMTHEKLLLSVKRSQKKRQKGKILRLVSFTSLASATSRLCRFLSPVQPACPVLHTHTNRDAHTPLRSCAHRRPGTYRSYVLMVSLWRDNKCGEAAGHRSAAPGQQEYWSAHFRSHLCSESSPGRRLLRADRDAPKGRGRVVGGLQGWTKRLQYTCPVLHQYAKDKPLLCRLIQKHPHTLHAICRNTNHSVVVLKVSKMWLSRHKCITSVRRGSAYI